MEGHLVSRTGAHDNGCPRGTHIYKPSNQFRILREKGTELAGTGEYEHFKGQGIYTCAGCHSPLYKSTTKFDSGCGWPAFFDGKPARNELRRSDCLCTAIPGAVTRQDDFSRGTVRTEIVCTACGGHLGHVFKGEGFKTPSA